MSKEKNRDRERRRFLIPRRSKSTSRERGRTQHRRSSRHDARPSHYRSRSRFEERHRLRAPRDQNQQKRSAFRNHEKDESQIGRLASVLSQMANTDLSASEWLDKVQMYATMYEWNDVHKLYLASVKLGGIAKKWYDGLKEPPIDWVAFRDALIRQFSSEENFGKLFEIAN